MATTLKSVCSGALFAALSATIALASDFLFPSPLHLTRLIVDPISGRSNRVEEYFAGDRAVSLRGDVAAIADYGRGELTVIDRRAATYSVTPFAQLAAGVTARSAREKRAVSNVSRGAGRNVADRAADVMEGTVGSERVIVALDREIALSREAIEVVLGGAWPRDANPELELVLAVAESATASSKQNASFPLPLEQRVIYEVAGETVESRNVVIRVGSEIAPPELIEIPSGAMRVEAEAIARARILQELDSLTPRARMP